MAIRTLCVALIVFAVPRLAAACTCYDVPPCQGFWLADSVFTGVVTAVTEPTDDRPAQTHTETTFRVEHGFKGEKPGALVIRGNARNTINTCMFYFKPGERYIVYARRDADGALTTSSCSRTKPLSEAAADLAYARRLPNAGSGGRIYGHVSRAYPDILDPSNARHEPVPGLKITLQRSNGPTRVVETNRGGGFEAKGLEPGTYTVSAAIPDTMVGYYDRSEIALKDRACAPFSIWFEPNGRIAGRVVDTAGKPVATARVWSVPVKYTNSTEYPQTNLPTVETDEDGRYQLGPLPAGEYHVGVMAAPGWWREPPANATYHPGVNGRYQAEAVSLKEGERRADVDFRVERPTRLTISGTVVWSNGTPAADVDVRLVSEGGVIISATRTNTSGEFMLTGVSGSTYVVRATFYRSPENNGSAEQTIALGAEPVAGLQLVLRPRTR